MRHSRRSGTTPESVPWRTLLFLGLTVLAALLFVYWLGTTSNRLPH